MDIKDFKSKMDKLTKLAEKYKWSYLSCDSNVGRVSFKDELGVYRVDIYTTKMTVCIMPAGSKPIYKKRQDLKMIENILKNAYKF